MANLVSVTNTPATPVGTLLRRVNTEAFLASSVVFILFVMLVPLPPFLLDVLLATNITNRIKTTLHR